MALLIPGVVFVLSALLTAVIRRYALHAKLLDVPNCRSSHRVPTPRGGGLAIVLSYCGALLVLWRAELVPWELLMAVGVGGMLVAAVGLVDDHRSVPPPWRLAVHFAAVAWVLWWFGGVPALPLAGWDLESGWLGTLVATFFLVWLLNLYNFMDGIDGIAGIQAVTVLLGAAVLTAGGKGAMPLLLLAAASGGFLLWNWPPAKIFMGDAGSAFLGFAIGALALYVSDAGETNLWVWLILMAAFVADATVTLIRRLARREKVFQAHRLHAYQHASRRYGSHLPVTLVVAALNLLWLLPLAWLASMWPERGWWLAVLAYSPVIVLVCAQGAGRCEDAPVGSAAELN